MKHLLLLAAALHPVAYAHAGAAPPQTPRPHLAIINVDLIDVATGQIRHDVTVQIAGQRIHSITDSPIPGLLAETIVIDGRDKFLIPGLWDMHVHVTDATEIALPALIAHGVTGVRDMGGDLEGIDRWRDEITAGTRIGPHIVRPGPYVDGPKPDAPYRLTVTTPAAARAAVRDLADQGVDFIKIHNALPRDAYFALAEAAQVAGINFAGHVPVTVQPAEAATAGQKSLEHMMTLFEGTFTTEHEKKKGFLAGIADFKQHHARALFEHFAASGTYCTPTLIAYHASAHWSETQGDPRGRYIAASLKQQWDRFFPIRNPIVERIRQGISKSCLELVGLMHEVGVPLLAGTDLALRDVFPGASLHDELAMLVEAGLKPHEALHAATLAPAEFLERESDYGPLAPGRYADLVLLDADPLDDIDNTKRISAVILHGRHLTRKQLDALLADVAAAAPNH